MSKELENLRRSVRQLQIALTLTAGLATIALWKLNPKAVHADAIPAVITAKQFIVVDDTGSQSMVIGPIPGLNTQQLNVGADFRGLAVFGANNAPLATLGIGVPRSGASGSAALHYSELFLQSDNNTHNQAYIRALGPDSSSSTRLHLSNLAPNALTVGTMDAIALPQGAGQVSVGGSGSVGGRGTTAGSAINAAYNGVPGITNCPPPNDVCGPVH